MTTAAPAPTVLRVDPGLPIAAAPPVYVAVLGDKVFAAARDALRPEMAVVRIAPDVPARELARFALVASDFIACGPGLALAGARPSDSQPVVVVTDEEAREQASYVLSTTPGSFAFGPRLICRGGGVEAVWVTGLARDALLWERVGAGRSNGAAAVSLPDPSYDVAMAEDDSGIVVARAHGRTYAVEIGRIENGVIDPRSDVRGIEGAVSIALGKGPSGLVLAFLSGRSLAAVHLDSTLAPRGPVTTLLPGPLRSFSLFQGPEGTLAVSWMDLVPSKGEGYTPGIGPQSIARLDGETLRLGPALPVLPAGLLFLAGAFHGSEIVLAHGTQAPSFSVLTP